MRRGPITIAAVGVAAVALIGLALTQPTIQVAAASLAPAGTPASPGPRPAEAAPAVSQGQAEQAAVAAVGGGTAVASHLDHDDGITEWDVRVDGPDGAYEVEVDAATGEVVGFERDDDDDEGDGDDERVPITAEPTVDQAAAEAAAVAAVGGGEAVASHLDRDDGLLEWEVAVVTDPDGALPDGALPDGALYEVAVDAVDGTIREVDRDD